MSEEGGEVEVGCGARGSYGVAVQVVGDGVGEGAVVGGFLGLDGSWVWGRNGCWRVGEYHGRRGEIFSCCRHE